jgi:hypothetical protein
MFLSTRSNRNEVQRMIDYPYIRAYGKILGSRRVFVDAEVEWARQEHAPQTAVCKKEGAWITFDQVQRPDTRLQLAEIVKNYAVV